jgi:hypothetical protein
VEGRGDANLNTGIKAENMASQAACAKAGRHQNGLVTAFCFHDTRPRAA